MTDNTRFFQKRARYLFVIIAKNRANSVASSLHTLKSAILAEGVAHDSIIAVVDDGSSDDTTQVAKATIETDDYLRVVADCLRLKTSRGMANAIIEAAKLSDSEFIIPLGASDQITLPSLQALIRTAQDDTITISYRTNWVQARPPLKVIASFLINRVMLQFTNLPYREVTGVYVFPRDRFVQVTPTNAGHGFMIYSLLAQHSLKKPILQIWIELKPDLSGQRTRAIPRFVNGLNIVYACFFGSLYVRKKISSNDSRSPSRHIKPTLR